MSKIKIVGACCDLGVNIDGSKNSPFAIEKKIGEIDKVISPNVLKSNKKDDYKKNIEEIYTYQKNLYNKILSIGNKKIVPLIIGGDHSISIATSLASIKVHENLGIIWFDSHADFNTLKTTKTGNIHGIPFAVITNFDKKFETQYHQGNFFNPKNAVLVGVRDIDMPYEYENLKKAGVTIFTTEDIKKYGSSFIYKKAFEIALNGTNGVHVSIDIDVLDPKIAPGVSVPVKNGLNLDEMFAFVDQVIEKKELVTSIDVVEFNTKLDKNNITLNIVKQIINKLTKYL